jgi:hypothetical protein
MALKDLSRPKKMNAVTPNGLGICKDGKLKYPFIFTAGQSFPPQYNNYGQPRPVVGDYCVVCIPSGRLTAGTVGKIISEDANEPIQDGSYTVEYLDGKVEKCWRYSAGHITLAQVQEVVDYYSNVGRPERVVVTWKELIL